jgi:hypothetical protein
MPVLASAFHVVVSIFCFVLFEAISHYAAHIAFELSILLLQPPECWDYSHKPPYLANRLF